MRKFAFENVLYTWKLEFDGISANQQSAYVSNVKIERDDLERYDSYMNEKKLVHKPYKTENKKKIPSLK